VREFELLKQEAADIRALSICGVLQESVISMNTHQTLKFNTTLLAHKHAYTPTINLLCLSHTMLMVHTVDNDIRETPLNYLLESE